MLSGCNDIAQQKHLAETAAQRFQSLYNGGSCEQLYDDASRYFQAHERRVRWLGDCDQLHKRRKARHRNLLITHYDQHVEERSLIIRQIPVQADIGRTILKLRRTLHPNDSDLAKQPAIVFIRSKFRPAAGRGEEVNASMLSPGPHAA